MSALARTPLDPDAIEARIRAAASELRGHRAAALILFGSVAQGAAHPASDVDIAVEEGEEPMRYQDFMALYDALEDLLLQEIDLVPARSLAPPMREELARTGRWIVL